jgi:glucose-1-phosphate cytidylyltransferase
MKVVLFCGGLGTRLREYSETVPKPLVNIGARPILWHLMKYYAHFGHTEFILCLGYRGDLIRRFFIDYDARDSNTFVMRKGESEIRGCGSDVGDWTIHFVDTGLHSNIGQRLMAVREFVGEDELFLANYSDQLSDMPHDGYVERFRGTNMVASFVSVRPPQSYHVVSADAGGTVERLRAVGESDVRVNGGFLVMRREIFEFMKPGEELVEQPFARLIGERRLMAHRYDGFWKPMDTFKDKMSFDEMDARRDRPWMVWERR